MDRIVVNDIRKTFQLKPGQFVTVDGEATDRVTVLTASTSPYARASSSRWSGRAARASRCCSTSSAG
nr:hypothetical protein [Mesorhizobium sp.]